MAFLGVILAGGQSRRFGGDKARALVDGVALLDHVAAALAAQTDRRIVCGRSWPGLTSVPDRPAPDLGPLGGLCAALHYAAENGFESVLTAGCDVLPLPRDLRVRLDAGPSYLKGQPLFGLWPAALAGVLDAHLATQEDRSIRRWIERAGARAVQLDIPLFNLNTPADLAAYLLQRR